MLEKIKTLASKRLGITVGAGAISTVVLVKNLTQPNVVITALICLTVLGVAYIVAETVKKS